MNKPTRQALKIAAIYAVIGTLWIYYSDIALKQVVDDVAAMRLLQTWKGLFFIVVTAALVFWMSRLALSRQARLIDQLEHKAYYEELTGLPNRRLLEKRLEKAIRACDEPGCQIALVGVDIDQFSAINDSFGYPVGDQLLQNVGQRLTEALPEHSTLAHIGADEFLVMTEMPDDDRHMSALIKRLGDVFSSPFRSPDVEEVHLTASMGASRFPHDGDSSEQLLQRTEAALARAKREAPGEIRFFKEEMIVQARRYIDLDARLRRALQRDEFELHYQPIVDTSGRVTGVEALLRWQPADADPVSPAEFIPVAEDTGLIVEIGDWVTDEACRQLAAWQADGITAVTMAINLSARQMESGRLVDHVERTLLANRLRPSDLTLELTESQLMQRGKAGRDVLDDLHGLGVGLALDDFGTGYSSLSYLRSLPVGIIKIDRSFVQNLEQNDLDRDLAAVIVSMARIFGLSVIAEGVETREQQRILAKLGCERYQGYYFSRPLPASEVRPLLDSDRTPAR